MNVFAALIQLSQAFREAGMQPPTAIVLRDEQERDALRYHAASVCGHLIDPIKLGNIVTACGMQIRSDDATLHKPRSHEELNRRNG